jgi:UDP-N-acetylglucosamine transferase subunit ALG13
MEMQSSSARSSSNAVAPPSATLSVATLVTAGTHEDRFHRLEAVVADLAAGGPLPSPVLLQTGADNPELDMPEGVTAVDFLEPASLEAQMRSARYVITHGGPGSIFMAIEAGHRPIAVPRSAAHGEHVDDHQMVFVRAMGERGLVHALEEPADLEHTLRSMSSTRSGHSAPLAERKRAAKSFTTRFATIADALV